MSIETFIAIEVTKLTPRQKMAYDSYVNDQGKQEWAGWLLGVLFMGIGNNFYYGKIGRGIAVLCLGWLTLGIWNLVEFFMTGSKHKEYMGKVQTEALAIAKSVAEY
jgi:TM2 domain-containing membrane protein YozV